MIRLAPSILAADFNCLGEQFRQLEQNGVEYLHIDVMDGLFVPSISFGMPLIASVRRGTGLFFDVHLMVQEPIRYIEEFVEAGADCLTVHVEACRDVCQTLCHIKNLSKPCGITLNPETSLDRLVPVLPMVDLVLVMSVHPGFGGQEFMPESLDKVRELKRLRREKNLHYQIEIDGGINQNNLRDVVLAGADIIVAGTAVFAGDIAENIRSLEEEINHAS